ncbi:hypothetical protein FGO68_gene246 [Halteria grandinella]|uniref:Uncharacterized protein n=1 Tax=Halteria grandinella TaxID=5974 RepID=A0A8J8NMR3_HALGN|nr:hypothetical protein FGO68_gene246 [Halteria grandinella]
MQISVKIRKEGKPIVISTPPIPDEFDAPPSNPYIDNSNISIVEQYLANYNSGTQNKKQTRSSSILPCLTSNNNGNILSYPDEQQYKKRQRSQISLAQIVLPFSKLELTKDISTGPNSLAENSPIKQRPRQILRNSQQRASIEKQRPMIKQFELILEEQQQKVHVPLIRVFSQNEREMPYIQQRQMKKDKSREDVYLKQIRSRNSLVEIPMVSSEVLMPFQSLDIPSHPNRLSSLNKSAHKSLLSLLKHNFEHSSQQRFKNVKLQHIYDTPEIPNSSSDLLNRFSATQDHPQKSAIQRLNDRIKLRILAARENSKVAPTKQNLDLQPGVFRTIPQSIVGEIVSLPMPESLKNTLKSQGSKKIEQYLNKMFDKQSRVMYKRIADDRYRQQSDMGVQTAGDESKQLVNIIVAQQSDAI